MDQGVGVVHELLDEATFSEVADHTVNVARNIINGYDDEFQRTYLHNYPPFIDLHYALSDFASDLFGMKLKPSYLFVSNYHEGGVCPLHLDRPQCFRTIDLCVSDENDEPWPLKIADPWTDDQVKDCEGELHLGVIEPDTEPNLDVVWNTVLLRPNDAACYSGTHQWHYRPIATAKRADLIFFHFVPEDFNGPLN